MSKYVLTGPLKCAECDSNFVIKSDLKRGYAYYMCGTRSRSRGCFNDTYLPQEKLETAIFDRMQASVLQPDFIEAYFRKVLEASLTQTRRSKDELKRLEAQLADAKRHIKEYLAMIADRRLPREDLTEMIQAEQKRKIEIEAQLAHH